jgi:hypothetical protein
MVQVVSACFSYDRPKLNIRITTRLQWRPKIQYSDYFFINKIYFQQIQITAYSWLTTRLIETNYGATAATAAAAADRTYFQLYQRFLPWGPHFNTRAAHVGSVVDKVALGQILFRVLRFHLPVIVPSSSVITLVIQAGTIGLYQATVLRESVSPHSKHCCYYCYKR